MKLANLTFFICSTWSVNQGKAIEKRVIQTICDTLGGIYKVTHDPKCNMTQSETVTWTFCFKSYFVYSVGKK